MGGASDAEWFFWRFHSLRLLVVLMAIPVDDLYGLVVMGERDFGVLGLEGSMKDKGHNYCRGHVFFQGTHSGYDALYCRCLCIH